MAKTLYADLKSENLSEINYEFIRAICSYLKLKLLYQNQVTITL